MNLQLSGSSLAENRPAGTVVGTLTATDPEAAPLTYSLVNTGVPFEIINGELRTTSAFDFETTASYTLTIRATDAGGASVESEFVVNVIDVAETPIVPPVVPPALPSVVPPVTPKLVVPGANGSYQNVGSNGQVLRSITIATAGSGPPVLADLDGDGTPELVFGAAPGQTPDVRIYSSVDGTLLRTIPVYEAGFPGGVTVVAGDVDGDGLPELVTGALAGGGPRVRVIDPRTNAVLADFFAYESSFTGGVSVAVADFDGDGRADVVTGAGPGGGPRVRVFTGLELSINPGKPASIWDAFAYAETFSGGVSVGVADVNGDGLPDLITGAGPGGGPHVFGIDGRSLITGNTRPIVSFFATESTDTAGVRVMAIGLDLTDDGRDEILMTAVSLKTPSQTLVFDPTKPDRGTIPWEDEVDPGNWTAG